MRQYLQKQSVKCSKKMICHFSQTMWVVLTFILLCGIQGCASESTALTFSGFLGNYSGIRPAPDESGVWSYRKPGSNLRPYTKIMIDPLVIWPSPNSPYGGMNTATMWQLALAFHERMVYALQDGYTIVQEPGPGVLRLRAALTEVTLVRPALQSPGPLLPLVGDMILQSTEKISGLKSLSGQAAIEAELLDSQTHVRLVAYIENRKYEKIVITKNTHSLGPIRDIFDYWARKLRQRLDEERGLREYQKVIQ